MAKAGLVLLGLLMFFIVSILVSRFLFTDPVRPQVVSQPTAATSSQQYPLQ